MYWLELRSSITLIAALLLPGWSLLGLTKLWKLWDPFQRWCIALGIGIAFYPCLFYFARIFPNLRLGQNKIIILLCLMVLIVIWTLRNNWQEQFSFDQIEFIGAFLLVAVLFSRLVMVHDNPYPAWSDSLHHTLLTKLTMIGGRLPTDLLPYEPVQLDMYHLGLYSLSGLLGILSPLPAHTALLITSQILNGLNVIGVYVLLDWLVNRKAAVVGVVFVGFLSFQPAWYFNWGRFTQVASQSILLIALVLTLKTVRSVGSGKLQIKETAFAIFLSALVTAGVFLLHFRVAGFYLPLLAIFIILEYFSSGQQIQKSKFFLVILAIGFVSLFLVLPVLIDAVNSYLNPIAVQKAAVVSNNPYFLFSKDAIFVIGLSKILLTISILCAIIGIVYRSRITWVFIIWVVILWVEGHLYLLNIPKLAFTNYGAILIMFYLPASIFVGSAVGILLEKFELLEKGKSQFVALIIISGLVYTGSLLRSSGIESYRYFMHPQDEAAMLWIEENTQQDALFAIDTYMWNGVSPHGVDAGYWIPYFTNRFTTTGSMLYSLGDSDYKNKINDFGKLISESSFSDDAVNELCSRGVDYIYIGAKRDRLHASFDPDQLIIEQIDKVVFIQNGAAVLKTCQ